MNPEKRFQLTLPERGATGAYNIDVDALRVSTHTPRAGSDSEHFSIALGELTFQLTLPERGATSRSPPALAPLSCFNSHSPSGERHGTHTGSLAGIGFNSHSPSGERPASRRWCQDGNRCFNSHSPSGERPQECTGYSLNSGVSTHTPRAGSDLQRCPKQLREQFQLTLPERGATRCNLQNM